MEKVLVHTEKITKKKQKHLFQIPLPENAKEITGVKATIFPSTFRFTPHKHGGDLHLAIPDEGDVFFTDEIYLTTGHPMIEDARIDMDWNSRAAWWQGAKYEPFSIKLAPETTFIEGYYEDAINTTFNSDRTYTLRIYLYYST